jgi:hypothetical protein
MTAIHRTRQLRPKTSPHETWKAQRDMKALLNIPRAIRRQGRRVYWPITSALVLPVALLILTTCSSPTACAMGRTAEQSNSASVSNVSNAAQTQNAAVPARLPTHFSFGLMSAPGTSGAMNDMRTRNGTAWDFRYQYLSAGVNTGHGWATWNSPAGQFATYYLDDSATNGYIPAFVYYMLLQSNGPGGSGESGTDLAHLNSPSTMSAYYADWTLLMQKVGAFKKTALIVVEPDLWGYLEQSVTHGSNSAASISASVASSANADAKAYPNNAQGFAWALLHIRDKYAPNAVLALHSSPWGSQIDVASNNDASLNVANVGARDAQFLRTAGLAGNPSGVSTFDLVSADIADRDAAQSGNWWDPTNKALPNFSRYLTYASALSSGVGRSLMLWQVPIGNQYYDTENNSPGHTQDNKAQYILGHVADFVRAGIIGILFGPGNGGTSALDGRNDGVTNPAPISTFQCNLCNNHTSSYADDDGGYLRINLGQYYKNGGSRLGPGSGGGTPTATTTADATATTAATETATSSGSGTPTVAPCAPGTRPGGTPTATKLPA